MPSSIAESDTGSTLIVKYASQPKLHRSRKFKNINNFKSHMQSLSESLDNSYFKEEENKSTFQKVLEDPEQLEFVHKFFKLSEESQNKVISSLNVINEESDLDNEPSNMIAHDYELIEHTKVMEVDGFCYVYQSAGQMRKYCVKRGLDNLSKKCIKFLQRQHPLEDFQLIENELRSRFLNNVGTSWQANDYTPFQRYITHIIAKYLGLVSTSFSTKQTRIVRVSNPYGVFEPPENHLYQEMANINVF